MANQTGILFQLIFERDTQWGTYRDSITVPAAGPIDIDTFLGLTNAQLRAKFDRNRASLIAEIDARIAAWGATIEAARNQQ